MMLRLVMVVVAAAAIGAVVLGLRQQRLQLMHEITKMHGQMNRQRHDIWDLQIRIADRLEPERLRHAVAGADLDVEPITPSSPPGEPVAVADADHGRR